MLFLLMKHRNLQVQHLPHSQDLNLCDLFFLKRKIFLIGNSFFLSFKKERKKERKKEKITFLSYP